MIPTMHENKVLLILLQIKPIITTSFISIMQKNGSSQYIMFNSTSEECETLIKSECLWNVWMVIF